MNKIGIWIRLGLINRMDLAKITVVTKLQSLKKHFFPTQIIILIAVKCGLRARVQSLSVNLTANKYLPRQISNNNIHERRRIAAGSLFQPDKFRWREAADSENNSTQLPLKDFFSDAEARGIE
jgi:hypothetical protein